MQNILIEIFAHRQRSYSMRDIRVSLPTTLYSFRRSYAEKAQRLNRKYPFLSSSIKQIDCAVKNHSGSIRLHQFFREALIALESLVKMGLITEHSPYRTIENEFDIKRLIEFGGFATSILGDDIPTERALNLIPSDRCSHRCVYCYGDFSPKGLDLDYSLLESADPSFLTWFSKAVFGLGGIL